MPLNIPISFSVSGNIHAVNERQRYAEAVAVRDQRIVFLGSNEDAKR